MKKLIYFCLALYLFWFISSSYDRGYNAAWEGEALRAWVLSEKEDGYNDGLDDAEMYDRGYADGCVGKKPKNPNNDFYMDGYEFGKR